MKKKSEKKSETNILSELKKVDAKWVFPLSEPISRNATEKITELLLDEPKAKHIRQMPTSPIMDDILQVMGSLAQQPDSVMDELSMRDTNRLGEYFSAFS